MATGFTTPAPTRRDLEPEELVAWWAVPLALGNWRIVITREPEENGIEGRCSHHAQYPNARLNFPPAPDRPDQQWPFTDLEETVVHELHHILSASLYDLIEGPVYAVLPRAERKRLRRQWRNEFERMTERTARALVAVARARRSDPPPVVGGLKRGANDGVPARKG